MTRTGRIKRRPSAVARRARLPEIGKVKVGDKARTEGGKEYPISLDYFRATGKYAGLFDQTFGAKCDSLTITFISNDPAEACEERLVLRDKGGRLFAEGDGETFRVWNPREEDHVDVDAGTEEGQKILSWAVAQCGKDFDPVLTLRFILPDIRGVMGHWSFTTKGQASSIPQIREAFDFVLEQAGTVVGVPFDLQVEKVKSQKPGSKSTFPVVRLVPNISAGHLERVRAFIASGTELRGLLTEERIESIEPRQIGAGSQTPTDHAD